MTAIPDCLPEVPEERPITVADIWPFLSERGQVEVDSAIKGFRLAVAEQELAALRAEVVAPRAHAAKAT